MSIPKPVFKGIGQIAFGYDGNLVIGEIVL